MFNKKKILALAPITLFVLLGSFAVRQKERNLKVLPADISDAKLDSIMHTYTKALGEDCKFCHTPSLRFGEQFDYASDKNPMKENARDMMRLVIDINKKYFYYDSTRRPEYLNTVTCITCHNGHAIPAH